MAVVQSYSPAYSGAYSKGGFMKVSCTGRSGAWQYVEDPNGLLPHLPHGGDIQFVRILLPVPRSAQPAGPPGCQLIARYQGTGGAEQWVGIAGATGVTAGNARPYFDILSDKAAEVYIYYVEYGRVHSTPR